MGVVSALALDVHVSGPSLPVPLVSGDLRGTIDLEKVDPITVTIGPAFGGDWLLEASNIELSALAELLAGHADPRSLMPSNLDLDGLSIVELGCRFDPDSWKVRSLTAKLGTPENEPAKTWTFGDGFPSVTGVGVSVELDFDDTADGGQDGGPSVTVVAGATVEFGELHLPVQVVRRPDQWSVGILGATGFPSLGDLVGAATDASMLPEAVKTLQLGSASLELTLGSEEPRLQSLFVAAALAPETDDGKEQGWQLIEDQLAIENLALQVSIDAVGKDASGFVPARSSSRTRSSFRSRSRNRAGRLRGSCRSEPTPSRL